MESWLMKKYPAENGKWQQRWCVLAADGRHLEYYADQYRLDKRGDVRLDLESGARATAFGAPDCVGDGPRHLATRPHGFALFSGQRLVYFDAECQDLLTAWIEAVSRHAEKPKAARQRPLRGTVRFEGDKALRWRAECTHDLCGAGEEQRFHGIATHLSTFASVMQAVERLNADASLEPVDGMCVVFSQAKQRYFLLYRADMQVDAFGAFKLCEAQGSTRDSARASARSTLTGLYAGIGQAKLDDRVDAHSAARSSLHGLYLGAGKAQAETEARAAGVMESHGPSAPSTEPGLEAAQLYAWTWADVSRLAELNPMYWSAYADADDLVAELSNRQGPEERVRPVKVRSALKAELRFDTVRAAILHFRGPQVPNLGDRVQALPGGSGGDHYYSQRDTGVVVQRDDSSATIRWDRTATTASVALSSFSQHYDLLGRKGPFDGRWESGAGIAYLIVASHCSSARVANAAFTVESARRCNLQDKGIVHTGTLADDGRSISWNDGDVWRYVGVCYEGLEAVAPARTDAKSAARRTLDGLYSGGLTGQRSSTEASLAVSRASAREATRLTLNGLYGGPRSSAKEATRATLNGLYGGPRSSAKEATRATLNGLYSTPRTSAKEATRHTLSAIYSAPRSSAKEATRLTLNGLYSAPRSSAKEATRHTLSAIYSAPRSSAKEATRLTLNGLYSAPRSSAKEATRLTLDGLYSAPRTSAKEATRQTLNGLYSGPSGGSRPKAKSVQFAGPTADDVAKELPPGPRICILGGTKIQDSATEGLLTAIAGRMAASLAGKVVVLTGGMPGVQAAFAKGLGASDSLIHLLPEGQASGFGVGRDVSCGATLEDRMEIFGQLGQVYLTFEGGPGVAKEARAAFERGAFVLPMISTGGASGGMFDFPTGALQKPAGASEAQWACLSGKASTKEVSAAVIDMISHAIGVQPSHVGPDTGLAAPVENKRSTKDHNTYLKENLSPVLEPMVRACMHKQPADAKGFMMAWLVARRDGTSMGEFPAPVKMIQGEEYMTNMVTPFFEPMVALVLKELPEDPLAWMLQHLGGLAKAAAAAAHGGADEHEPGVTRSTGEGGLPKLTLVHGSGGSTEIYEFGATLTSYFHNDREVIYLSDLSSFDGKQPIRGGVPVAFPQFARADSALPQHGFVRTCAWEVDVGRTGLQGDGSVRAVLTLRASDATRAIWPHEFEMEFVATLGPSSLQTSVRTKNLNAETEVQPQLLLHTYYTVPDITAAHVSGLQGRKYFDKVRLEEVQPKNQDILHFDRKCDKVFHVGSGVPRGSERPGALELAVLTTVDGADEPRPYLGLSLRASHEAAGAGAGAAAKSPVRPDVVVWNPWEQMCREVADLPDEDWQWMLCVEPGLVGSNRPTLLPGEAVELTQVITPRW